MAYIFNQYINPKKPIKVSITRIYGISLSRILVLLKNLNINPNTRTCHVSLRQINLMAKFISKTFLVTSSLRKERKTNKDTQMKIRSYKGFRHKKRLPLRGQRTHTNAKTRRMSKTN